jgi:hypothetical protein
MALLQFLDVNEGHTLELECHHKYLALSAANALIKYVEFSQGVPTATRCVIRADLCILLSARFCFARRDDGNKKLEGCLSRSHGTSSDGLCHHRGAYLERSCGSRHSLVPIILGFSDIRGIQNPSRITDNPVHGSVHIDERAKGAYNAVEVADYRV